MKKIILTALFLVVILMNDSPAEAKGGTIRKGPFAFEYTMEKEGVWITKISPVSAQGTVTLIIPSKIKGRNVVKLGAKKDAVTEMDDDNDDDMNLFGVCTSEDSRDGEIILIPVNQYERLKKIKIKTIRIPSKVKVITKHCFTNIPDGTSINIPAGVTENIIEQFTRVKWKKLTISAENKKYKVENACLLSRDGKVLHGFVQKKKTIVIPSSVKRIAGGRGDFNGCSAIVIPRGVTKIEKMACETSKAVTVKVAEGNKRYAVKDGSVYSKKSGRLVLAYVRDGVLKIPDTVTKIDGHSFLGCGYAAKLEKVIVPSSVRKMKNFPWIDHSNIDEIICEIQCKTPPKLSSTYTGIHVKGITIYVPKNCLGKYRKKWEIGPRDGVTFKEK